MNPETGKGRKILVLDDEPEICDLLKGWLEYLGFRVLAAANGDDGLWLAKSEKPDLVISDAMMPGRTGYELLSRLKEQDGKVGRTPVIIMSGRRSMEDWEGRADGFISKPFEPRDMLKLILKLLEPEREQDEPA